MKRENDIKPTLQTGYKSDCRQCWKKDTIISRLTRAGVQKQRYFDEKWLATRWGTTIKTLQKMRYAGRGPKVTMFGRSVRYRLRDVLSYERSLRDPHRT